LAGGFFYLANYNYIISNLYEKILNRFPSTYVKFPLILHETIENLQDYYFLSMGIKKRSSPPYAFCDGDTKTIHLASDIISKEEVAYYLLHEYGHLHALKKYGKKHKFWKNNILAEEYADNFAYRWLKKIKEEKII
jgi:Zn-dependent peptidase ImmA (M78 family)